MIPAQLISQKRDGGTLTDSQILEFISRFATGDIPDYQMSAMAMAIYFQGMTERETTTLTRALLTSGSTLQWNDTQPRVDKHSTGGIGDKVSLVLAPVLAACGLQVPMLSGRGLGITGGTLDKLESLPGFRTDLSVQQLQDQTREFGCVITGASSELAPADRKLYALRDVTGTVPSQPLIVASIMSKKLAEGLDALVLDVKVGSGAFMKSEQQARRLAESLVSVGRQMGLPTVALLTDMDQPVGQAIGNAIEVREAIEVLRGHGPEDVLQLSSQLGNELLVASGVCADFEEAAKRQQSAIETGAAFEKFEMMVMAQGAAGLTLSLANQTELCSDIAGYIHRIDTALLGEAVIELGGGRRQMQDAIDHRVGFECLVRVGDIVERGQPLLRVFSEREFSAQTLKRVFTIQSELAEPRPLIMGRIT